MAEDFASGLTSGFNSMSRLRSSLMRGDVSQQRANVYAQNAQNRIPLLQAQTAMIRQRIAQMPEQLKISEQNAMNGSLNSRLAQLNYQLNAERLKFMEQQATDPNSTKNQALTLRQRKAGMPTNTDLPNGTSGVTTFPTAGDLTKQQTVINAWPQMQPLLAQVKSGANYFVNKPGKFKKYIAALNAAWTGDIKPADEKILEQAGISSSAITQLAEVQSNIMNVPKVESVYNQTHGLFNPHEGETPQSYKARVDSVTRDNARRYYQALFNTQYGEPADKASSDARDQYVKDSMAQDPIIASLQDEETTVPVDDIESIAKSLNSTPDKVRNALKQLESKGYSPKQAMEHLKNA